jgi:hypothetical protein
MISSLRGIRFESGKFFLDGYPEGCSIRGLGVSKAQELSRFHLFKRDLDDVYEWIFIAKNLDQNDSKVEALYIAALIKFMSCFENTSGLRQKPLKQKNIFHSSDRACLQRLRRIRNKMVAHDEHLYPGEYPLIVLDGDAKAIEAVSFTIKAPFSGLSDIYDLDRLAQIAKKWVDEAFENIATEIVTEVNSLTNEERVYLRDTTPEFTINIMAAEDRLKK